MTDHKERKVPLTIRIPEALRRQLARLAKTRGTSLNAEILQRLQMSIDANGTAAIAKPILDELRQMLNEARRK
jgi:Arc-like DNA binding domain